MKKTFLFLMVGCLFISATSVSYAALFFKMTSDKTTLNVGETATIELFAFVDDPLAAGNNGLNSWQLNLTPGGDGAVHIQESTILQFTSFASSVDMLSINSPDGSIEGFAVNANVPPADSTLGVGGYGKIAEFMIIGVAEGPVTYVIGGGEFEFFGILRDNDYFPMSPTFNNMMFSGVFDEAGSISQIMIIPEPAAIMLFGGVGFILARRRKCGR